MTNSAKSELSSCNRCDYYMIFANRNVKTRNNVSRPRKELKPDHGKSYSNFRLSVRQVNTLTWGRDMPKIRYKVMRLNTFWN